MKRNLGFVLIATVVGPHGPAPDFGRARSGKQTSATTPGGHRQHFISRWWPPRSWGLWWIRSEVRGCFSQEGQVLVLLGHLAAEADELGPLS